MKRENSQPFESNGHDQSSQLLHELRMHQAELKMQNEALRRTQHELEASRARYFDLYEMAPVGYLTICERGLIVEANLTAASLLGVVRDTMLEKPLSSYVIPDDLASYRLHRALFLESSAAHSWEMRMLHSDGTSFRAHLQATPARNGECWITLYDITELWLAKQELLKSQKIESLGILAGGIAHDFNNILAVILGNISLARLQLNEPEKAAARLKDTEKAIFRAKQLARQLLTFSKGGKPLKKIIDVRSILKDATAFALFGSDIRCTHSVAGDLWPVEADEGQIVQVIHNLVLNAVHAMPDGGTISIVAENVRARQNGNRFVKFSITDTGSGISDQHMLKIFDPYFTTKQQGSGLGLATCHSIIRRHGGKIRAKSTLGKGSTFTISLPASFQEPVSAPEGGVA